MIYIFSSSQHAQITVEPRLTNTPQQRTPEYNGQF